MQTKELKKIGFKSFWALEVLFFLYFYIFSKNGIISIKRLEIINKSYKCDIINLQNDIVKLKKDLSDWDSNNDYKMLVARKDLQLGYDNEEYYIIR